MVMVSAALKIKLPTLKLWKSSEWWKEIEQELRIQEDLQLSQRLQKIVSKSLDVVEDRLDNGDFVYDQKSGKLKRRPVAMKDAHKVVMDMQERREVLVDRHIQNESISTDKIEKTLEGLAAEFARIAKKVTADPKHLEVTDVVFGEEHNAKEKP
jgi:hypothetical protein